MDNTWPSLVQIMAWHLLDAKPLSAPMLVYCKLGLSEQTWMTFLSRNSNIFIRENAFENVLGKITVILPWHQCGCIEYLSGLVSELGKALWQSIGTKSIFDKGFRSLLWGHLININVTQSVCMCVWQKMVFRQSNKIDKITTENLMSKPTKPLFPKKP